MGVHPKQPNQIDIEVGNKIRLRRRLTGMSQTALGTALGITFQQVQKYEKGTNRVGASRLSDMARILGVPVSYFFEDGQTHDAAGDSGESDLITQFVGSSEGLALNKAFAQIPDVGIRRKVLSLEKALADEEQ